MITSLTHLLLLVVQLSSLTLIYQQVSKIKLSYKEIILLVVLTIMVLSFMSYFFYVVIILYFYFLGMHHRLKQKKNLAAFYSIYSVTTLTVIGSLTQLLIDRFFSTNLTITLLLQLTPFFINRLMLRVFETNFDFLVENYERVNKKILLNVNVLLFLLCTFQFSGYFFELRMQEIELLNILKTIAFFVIILVLLFYLNMKTQLLQKEQLEELKETQLNDLTQYTTQIEELYGEIRNIRHDYVNIIASLKIGIEENDMEQIKEIYTEVLSEVNRSLQNNKYDLIQLSKIKIPAVKGIISAKLLTALQEGLTVNVEILNEIEEVYINTLDFIRILSIFLDNAIEAAGDTETKQLTIGLIQEQTKQIIIVNNSTQEGAIDKRKIFSKGYSTKGSKRGLGLAIVKDILANYPNASLETEFQSNHFTQTLSIQKEGITG
ncbi:MULTISPECIES: sensor histidine kinase [unclassified Enterococcus]|uniref:sensor histidine kinase n=1 Tax=unclassified Enterococcus TaxID=2608891 RepID=UPI001CE145FF|nr:MULTISPECIES: GHKL domain-containing protein [unclassified Enterococcus]MCA5013695.1 GHKL domain-containing protein [Enterococcus sp. S23]MCA5016945.1 GHKL domain-containing protein [Enterococcus sp. S22(2020)]